MMWPNEGVKCQLGSLNPHSKGCIGLIDETLVEIHKLCKNAHHLRGSNMRKKMYCMENTVIVSHEGIFLHFDLEFPGSLHNVTILRHSQLYQECLEHFTYTKNYFEH